MPRQLRTARPSNSMGESAGKPLIALIVSLATVTTPGLVTMTGGRSCKRLLKAPIVSSDQVSLVSAVDHAAAHYKRLLRSH